MIGIGGSASSVTKSKTLRIKPVLSSISSSVFIDGGDCYVFIENIGQSKSIINGAIAYITITFSPSKGKKIVHSYKSKISRSDISSGKLMIPAGKPQFSVTSSSTVSIELYIKSRGVESESYSTTTTVNPKKPSRK